jgi:hypothetical protein
MPRLVIISIVYPTLPETIIVQLVAEAKHWIVSPGLSICSPLHCSVSFAAIENPYNSALLGPAVPPDGTNDILTVCADPDVLQISMLATRIVVFAGTV